MSATSLDLLDMQPYEAKQVDDLGRVKELYEAGWRCVGVGCPATGGVIYVLERPAQAAP